MTPKNQMSNKDLVGLNEQLTARVKELEAANEALNAQVKELSEKPVAPAPPPQPSKSKMQAEAALALLKQGPVTSEMLKEINPKYPSDPIYFVRTILKQPVVTNRSKESGKTTYSLPEQKPADQA